MKTFLLLIPILFSCSCSINTVGIPGSVETRYYDNETCRIKDVSAWGFHLRTNPSISLTVGTAEFRYLTPKPNTTPSNKLALLEAITHRNSKNWNECEPFESKNPFILHHTLTGLSFGSDHFLLGMQKSSRLLVPKEFKGLLIYNFNEEISKTQAYIKKEKE